MSDQENQGQKPESNESQGQVVSSSGGFKRKKEKRQWTMKDCKKAAGRYANEDAWKTGSPSSYKAAVSHKWLNDCLKHQEWRKSEVQSPDVSLPASA